MRASGGVLKLVLVAAISVSLSEAKQPHRKVLILGAGLSGIVAGKTLQDNGIDDFLVLEGQDYIGGRIKQVPFAGYKVEEGANLIHSFQDPATRATLWKLKMLNNVRGVIRSETLAIRNENGSRITDVTDITKLVKVMKSVKKTINEKEGANKLSAREGLELLGWNPKTPLQYAFEWWFFDYGYAQKVENISFTALWFDENDENFLVGDQRGVIELYRDLFKGFKDKIKLNSTVVAIKYDSSSVEVKLSNGEVYTADYVLCTFSTGVLSSNMVTFTPPLPQWKKKAISEKPLGAFTKIFLKFSKRFWEDKDDILMVNSKRGYYPIILNLDTQGLLQGSGVMLLVVTGDEARRIEKQSFNDTRQEIVKLLKGIYGSNFTEPTDIHYARWTQNPYIRGAYSEGTVGFSASKNHEDMAKHLGKLYFSGEATSEEWYGYMQGAYMTGQEQAQNIAKAVKCDEDKKNCPVSEAAVGFQSVGIVVSAIAAQLYLQNWFM